MIRICINCNSDYSIESEDNPGMCPSCNLMICLFGKPKDNGTGRTKGVLNHG